MANACNHCGLRFCALDRVEPLAQEMGAPRNKKLCETPNKNTLWPSMHVATAGRPSVLGGNIPLFLNQVWFGLKISLFVLHGQTA